MTQSLLSIRTVTVNALPRASATRTSCGQLTLVLVEPSSSDCWNCKMLLHDESGRVHVRPLHPSATRDISVPNSWVLSSMVLNLMYTMHKAHTLSLACIAAICLLHCATHVSAACALHCFCAPCLRCCGLLYLSVIPSIVSLRPTTTLALVLASVLAKHDWAVHSYCCLHVPCLASQPKLHVEFVCVEGV